MGLEGNPWWLWFWSTAWGGLWLVQAAMTIWMLVDAYRRGADAFWFWIILLFQPLGAWGYFFAVKLPSLRMPDASGWSLFQKRVNLKELRYRAERSPTQANHWALAQALTDRGEFSEAVPHLDAVLAREPDYGQALYRLALCQVKLGRPGEAIPHLRKLHEKDERWSNYQGWRLLVWAQAESGDPSGAIASCRALVRLSPTSQNHFVLADQLHAAGQTQEACEVLEKIVEEHAYATGRTRRVSRPWVKKAQRLLKQLAVR